MTTPKELHQSPPPITTQDPLYAKLNTSSNNSPDVLISPLNAKHPTNHIENLTTVDPQSNSTIQQNTIQPRNKIIPEWSTMKIPKKNTVVDIKPYKKSRSLTEPQGLAIHKIVAESVKEEMPKTKFYWKKFANLFKKNPDISKPVPTPVTLKKRGSLKSHTENKIYPEPNIEACLETVNDEDEDQYDIDLFDKENLLENTTKLKNKEEKKDIYEKFQRVIKLEEDEYVYQNNQDSDEENDDHDKKFKLIDAALIYEKELIKVSSSSDPFYSLETVKKNPFEMNEMYSDPYPLLELRKKIAFVRCVISYIALLIIKNKVFEGISLSVIIWNTVMLMIDPNSTSSISNTFDTVFLILYTVEMGLKIVALGFVLNEGAYLRDYWNILDFTIITTGYIPIVIGSSNGVNLSSLRSLRVLRPLRTISTIKALRTILVTLFSAMPLIMSSVMVVCFFLLIFAIAGLQLFSGLLKKRCFYRVSGLIYSPDPSLQDPTITGMMCGYENCPGDCECGKIIANPNFGVINFDNIFYSYLMIFQCITLEGWTAIMYYVVRSFSIYCIIFFIVLVWICAYFLVNLTLAIISTKFKESQEQKNQNKDIIGDDEDEEENLAKGPAVIEIRNLKVCEKGHHKRILRRMGMANTYGANEEVFKKEKQNELRWDDLFELKERIREERERLDAEEDFNKIRDQELEGSNYKKLRKRKNDLKYLPKNKPRTNGRSPLRMEKMTVNNQKLKFVGIKGINHDHEKPRDKKRGTIVRPSAKNLSLLEKSHKDLEKLEKIVEKTDEEAIQMINLNEEELFLNEHAKRAENFKEIIPYQVNISYLLQPKTYKKNEIPTKQHENHEIIQHIEGVQTSPPAESLKKHHKYTEDSIKVSNQQYNSTHKVSEEVNGTDANIQKNDAKSIPNFQRLTSLKATVKPPAQLLHRKSTIENTIGLHKAPLNKKRTSLQMGNFQFLETKAKLTKKPSIHHIEQKKRRLSRKISIMSSFSDHEENSNLESTILNDSDFNIAGFEKQERNKSLNIIPEPMLNTSPFNRVSPLLHPLNSSRLGNLISQAMERSKETPPNQILEKHISIEDEANPLKTEPINNILTLPIENEYIIQDSALSKQMRSQDPMALIKDDKVLSTGSKFLNKIREKKMMKQMIPVAAFTQTDPENETDDNGHETKNLSEQASTRTFIESKATLEGPSKGWKKIFRSITLKKKTEIKKDESEKQKRVNLQKKYNVLHYKLMIKDNKLFESNSTDEVLESRIENLKLEKQRKFQELVKGKPKMPIIYRNKILNVKRLEQKRKREERKLLREMEKKRQDSIDFQTLTDENILLKILKIPQKSRKLPLFIHKNLLAVISKQRNALFGDRSSRSKITSLCSPASRTNLTNMSMNFSQKNNKSRRKKKKIQPVIKFDYELLKEAFKEKLYEKQEIDKKYSEFINDDMFTQVWHNDYEEGCRRDFYREIKVNLRWSGEDVVDFQENFNKECLKNYDSQPFSLHKIEKIQKRINRVTFALSSTSVDKEVWLIGFKGKMLTFQKYLRFFVNSRLFDHSMLLSVIFNTVILALDGLFYDTATTTLLDNFNEALTMIFTVEMVLKIVAETPKRYLADKMNIFDGSVVTISQVELWALSGTKGLSAFRTVRIFRTFRVLRVTRLLRSLEFMKIIINVVSLCIDSLIYIGFLLLLLNVIYSLIGIQIFSGNLDNQDTGIRQNFDNFNDAFLTVYQLMTVENWNDILTITMVSSVSPVITCIYLISWIFLGNYVFLNLILAILLEAFSKEWDNQRNHLDDDDDFEDIEEKEREREKKELIEKEQEARFKAMEPEELDMEILAKTKTRREKPLFEGVSCSQSMFLLSKTNAFRKMCYITVHSNAFENFILFLIILSSLKLAIDTYLPDNNADVTNASTYIDNIFNSLFTLECVMKVISFGFCFDEGSYLRDNWNRLDFIIVCSSLVDMSVASINLPFIKILRLLRTLRPLRFISHNINMKVVVTALMESAGPIANVSIVVLLIFLMFSIFGMSLFQDRFGYCDYDYSNGNPYHININMCENNITGGTWKTKEDNFDNIFRSMISIFIISTQENWPNMMFDAIDSNTDDIGPVQGSVPYFGYFYVVCLFVCNIFLINLFVGVIFIGFIDAQNATNEYHSIFLTPEQERWLDFQRMIAIAKTDFTSYLLPTNKYRKKVYQLVTSQYFEVFIMFCIVFNIIIMALTYEGSPSSYDTILEDINYFFTAVFIMECCLKNVGMGVRAYLYSGWNRFDLFVVSSSIVDLLMTTIGNSLFSFLRVGPQLARVLRVMRVSRLLKLVKSLKGIQKLLETLMLALPSLMNVGALMLLVFFIFSVLGVFLFKDITTGNIIDDMNNFSNFSYAMVLLFRCSTGENWWFFMFDTYKATPYAPLFWIPFIVICSFIMLNLFILVILDEFEKYSVKGDSPRVVFKESIVEFRKNWSALTRATKGTKMPSRVLIDFFKMLNPEIGFGSEARREMVAKEIMKMNITGDEYNHVYFNEVLFGALKRTFGDLERTKDGKNFVRRDLKSDTKKMIARKELETKKKIEKLKNEIIKRDINKFRRSSQLNITKKSSTIKQQQQTSVFGNSEMKSSNTLMEDSKKNINKKKVYLNPLVTLLFVGMTFKSWMNFQKRVARNEIVNDNNFEELSSDSEDDEEIISNNSSFIYEDEFDEEEQKEYEEKAKKPKAPKKNLLDYEKNDQIDSANEEKVEKSYDDQNNDDSILMGDERKQENQSNKGKSILRNTRMSAFAEIPKRSVIDKTSKRFSLKPDLLTGLQKNGALISEERDVMDSEESA